MQRSAHHATKIPDAVPVHVCMSACLHATGRGASVQLRGNICTEAMQSNISNQEAVQSTQTCWRVWRISVCGCIGWQVPVSHCLLFSVFFNLIFISSIVFDPNFSVTSRSPLHLQRCLDPSFPGRSWTWPLGAVGKNWVKYQAMQLVQSMFYKSYHLLQQRANPQRTDLTYWQWSQRCRP